MKKEERRKCALYFFLVLILVFAGFGVTEFGHVQTFDGSWEHIELENYHVLVDAIFQQQESAVRIWGVLGAMWAIWSGCEHGAIVARIVV